MLLALFGAFQFAAAQPGPAYKGRAGQTSADDDEGICGRHARAYGVRILVDVEAKHENADTRAEATDFVALMTPVIKAFCMDTGFDFTNIAL